MEKIDGQWYIPSGDKAFLLVDRYQGCEFEQYFPICDGKVKTISDYYNAITNSKCLIYEGRAYNGEDCAGYAVAKCFDKYENSLYIVCKESKGAFVQKQYRRDYGFYDGGAGFEWLKCPKVPFSYNLVIVRIEHGIFIHVHKFELENWLLKDCHCNEHHYEILT